MSRASHTVPPSRTSRRRLAVAAVLSATLVVLGACGDDGGVVQPTDGVASVAVTATATTLQVGQTTALQATVKDAHGQPLAGRSVAWSTTNAGVLTVSTAGEVTAVAAGTARVAATSEGKRGEVTLQVVPVPPPVVASVTLDATELVLAAGETRQLVATARAADGTPIDGVEMLWSVAGTSAASVSASGLVTARQMGVATVAAAAGGKSAQARVTVLGTSPVDLVFELWSTDVGGFERPRLHRLDLRTPDAVPALVVENGMSAQAAPSPDGSRIAFVCDMGGPAICIADADGHNVRALPGFGTLGGLLGDQPAWSPDGARIAFRGWAQGGPAGPFNPSHVWVMDADGSDRVQLTADLGAGVWHESPAWSPQQADGGYRIAYAEHARLASGSIVARIHSMTADGTDRRPESAAGEHLDDEPTWAPGGRRIAFVRTGGTASGDLWVVDRTTGAERQLMAEDPAGAQRAPAWSPDGALIAFASDHDIIGSYYAYQIYTVRPDGTGLQLRTDSRATKGNPAWLRRP